AALRARILRLDGSIMVSGTSVGTGPGSFEQYASIPQKDDIHYGVGAVLLALTSPAP
ncbi:MAG: glycosyl hydrolase, partial [Nitrospirae bacterium]|nr:glycosyl hydrolase [Nitrospirota bacterium]